MKDEKGHGSDPRGGRTGLGKVASIARAHGIPTGHFKVQSLNTKLIGNMWQTSKSYGRRAVAERVAQHMRTDGGYMRVRPK